MTHVVTPSKVQHEQPNEEDARDQLAALDACKAEILKVTGMKYDMQFTVVIGGATTTQPDTVKAIVENELEAIGKALNSFDAGSEVSVVNKLPVGGTHTVSDLFKKVFLEAEQVEASTKGLFSIQYANPGAYAVSSDSLVTKIKEGTLDFCGIAKGAAIQSTIDKLKATLPSATGIMVSWAGDVSVSGTHPNGGPWVVGVAEQDHDTPIIATLELRDGDSAATSGAQTHNDAHIYCPAKSAFLNKDTTDLKVITVSTPGGCALADALATAAFATSDKDSAKRFCMQQSNPVKAKARITQYVIADGDTGSLELSRSSCIGKEEPSLKKRRMDLHEKGGVVVVVGGGLAGLSAAIEAAKTGCKVTVLEKMEKVGGNSAKATSGINAWGTRTQGDAGVQDNEALFERDTHLSGVGGTTHPSLVRLLSTKAAEGVEWLTHEIGVPLTVLCQLGGAVRPRAHRVPSKPDGTPTPVGFTIINTMKSYIQKTHPEITFVTNAKVTSLISSEKTEVTGVRYTDTATDKECSIDNVQAVVLATGGYGYQCDTLKKHRPDLAKVPTTNGPWAQGDVFAMTQDLGVSLVDMDKVQVHPTGLVDPKNKDGMSKILGPEALRGSGGILLNAKGERFVNELDLRSVVTAGINEQGGTAYCVLNVEMQNLFGAPMLSFYEKKMGLFTRCADVAALAKHIGCDEAALKTTLGNYSESCKAGRCNATSKVFFPTKMCSEDTDFICAKVVPAVHYTMGGMEITASCEVQKKLEGGAVGGHVGIKRLFAAGECTGGVHGANRLGGNSLLECVVMGRTAGERAGTIDQKDHPGLSKEAWSPVTFREHRPDANVKYGKNSALLRFNLPGSLQPTGICLGEYVAIKGKFRGTSHVVSGFYSPVTRPYDLGCIDLLLRIDEKGGPNAKFFAELRPGDGLEMRSMGGLKLRKNEGAWFCENTGAGNIKKLNLIAGGTGVAPMIQVTRGASKDKGNLEGVKLLYAAETDSDLGLAAYVERLAVRHPGFFSYYFVLNHPPLGWTQGVNFIDLETTRTRLHPASPSTLSVICGPPIFEKIVKKYLTDLGHGESSIYCYSD